MILIDPLHDPLAWYKITHVETQVEQWDFETKGRSRSTGTSCFVLEDRLCTVASTVVPCNQIVQREYL